MKIILRLSSRRFLLMLFLMPLVLPFDALANPANLTRHLADYAQDGGAPGEFSDTFFGKAGSATLRVNNGVDSDPATKVTGGRILVNGVEILGPGDFLAGDDEIEVAVNLVEENNTIEVELACGAGGANTCPSGSVLKTRVLQLVTDVTMLWGTRVHFNTNVSNYDEARQFYNDIGYTAGSGFPDTNTLEVARSIGIATPTHYDGAQGPEAGGYLLHGNLINLEPGGGGSIDLIEFTIPRNNEPPYPHLYHLGMARAMMLTTDIDADYAYMSGSVGVEFLSPPVTRSNLTRFAIFKDLDGTFYELLEVPGVPIPGAPTNIIDLGPVAINVSDFERSREFYRMLGFEVGVPLAETDSLEVAQAMGLDEPYQIKGELLTAYGTGIELVQWISPVDLSPPYPIPINHFGIHRIAYATANLDADVAALKSQGVEFISPVAPCCSGPQSPTGIVSFYDPDGTIIELFGAVVPGETQDTDNDGLDDREDNCIEIENPDQCDTDGDGFGNICDPDLNNNRVVNFEDLGMMKAAFFGSPGAGNWNPDADFTCNDVVNFTDLAIMYQYFFDEPGPSGIVWP